MHSSTTPDPHYDDTRRNPNTVLAFVFLPVLGGIAGFVGYIVSGLVLEIFCMPTPHGMTLSYGQAAALISSPVCAVLGSAMGFAFAFVYIHRYLVAAVFLMLVAILGAAVILPMWNQQVAYYGPDPSEMILFYPPLALCGLAAMASIGVAAIGLARCGSTTTKKPAP